MNNKKKIARRDFLKQGSFGLLAASLASSNVYSALEQIGTPKKCNIGVIGTGGRGRGLMKILLQIPGVKVPALCDININNLKAGVKIVEALGGYTPEEYSKDEYDYRRMLERDDLDAVMIATSVQWHTRMSVDAMKAGKDVGCEVPAGDTLDEMWNLVKTKEQTGRRYMLLENYNFTRARMRVGQMVKLGLFGEPYYAECGYIHDCKSLMFNSDESLTWRGERARDNHEHAYSTHSLGPVCKWFGINEGDRLEYMTTMMTKPRTIHEYAVKRFGEDSAAAKIDFKRGDFYTSTIHTAQGKVIRLDFDYISNRPVDIYYLMQGTKGVYNSRSGIFLEGQKEQYRSVDEYNQYEHPDWEKFGAEADKTGHGGGDYFVIREFVDMVKENREPYIDVYDAATWTCISHHSLLSLDNKGQSVDLPDFTQGKWKDKNHKSQS